MQNKKSIAPAILLMIFAPLIAEVLPGATRFSSIFVFPIEMCVWGGGALLIRYAIRKWKLGSLNMLLLALALSIAEEFLIQQTSIAPMVIHLKGVTYARAFGVNYVYLLWALIYESVFVVFLPVYLVELIFPKRREDLFINKKGVALIIILFLIGSFLAWYSWTQIARPKVFHVPAYNPTAPLIIIAVALIAALIFIALGPFKNKLIQNVNPLSPAPAWLLSVMGILWAIILYGIVVLAFGDAPSFPPVIALIIGALLAACVLYFLPRWTMSLQWQCQQTFALIFGTIVGSMLVSFLGFIWAANMDLYFKIVVNIIAAVLLIILGRNIKKRSILFKQQVLRKAEIK